MDFIVGLPRMARHHDAIWVIVDQLTKSSRFMAIKISFTAEQLPELYLKEIVRFHGIPLSIVSDRETKFVFIFWHVLQSAIGTELNLSTTFHPQIDE